MINAGKQSRKTHAAILAMALAPVAAVFSAQAAWAGAPATWSPPATPISANWSDATNWGGTAPVATGTLTFSGTNNLTTNNDFAALTQFNGIAFDPTSGGFTLGGNSITLGVQVTAAGNATTGDIVSSSSSDQTIALAGIAITPGKHAITTGTNALNITSPITLNRIGSNGPVTGTYVAFTSGGGNINLTGTGLANDATGILGGWATTGTSWASLDTNNNVIPYAGYTDVGGTTGIVSITDNAATNVQIPTNGAAVNAIDPTVIDPVTQLPITITHINTLQFGNGTAQAAAQVVDVGAGNTLVLGPSGGMFNATGVAGATIRALQIGASVAAGGTLTAGDGINPASITFSSTAATAAQLTAGAFTIDSVIADNATVNPTTPAPVSVTIASGYVTFGTGVINTFTGGINILSGRLSQVTQAQVGNNTISIGAGGEINTNAALTNNISIAGNGTTEGGGLGALRLYATTPSFLSGTITLTANASVGANGLATANNGFSGLITGPGGLSIGTPGGNGTGAGTISIGSVSGTYVANNYAGDTTITGTASGAVNSTLMISAATDNNIMPHGATGSYTGGATGNLILNATATTREAIFDLNGSTQTVNGLFGNGAFAANNIVQSSVAGGSLIIGDNNANGAFAGVIQDGAGTMAITKIGNGTQTLTGTSTYSGGTTINGGKLLVNSTSGSGTGTGPILLNGGTLGGTGTVAGGVVAGAGPHTINPGATGAGSVGTLTTGDVITNANTTLAFDLASPTGPNDLLAVSGNVTLNGGTLAITSQSVTGTASLGYYPVISYTGALTGGTAGIVLPAVANNIAYTLDASQNAGFIDVHRGYIGDANDDGTVDLNDLNVVLNNLGTTNSSWGKGNFDGAATIDLNDLNDVLNNLGTTIPSTSGMVASVAATPEPATLSVAGIGAIALLLRRKRA